MEDNRHLNSYIGIFDIFKIGIGPSSSHTMGPWLATKEFMTRLRGSPPLPLKDLVSIRIELLGSLAKTGKGHATDMGVIMGLLEEFPDKIRPLDIARKLKKIHKDKTLCIRADKNYRIDFDPEQDIIFKKDSFLPYHPNALVCIATYHSQNSKSKTKSRVEIKDTYYSVGGGFIEHEDEINTSQKKSPITKLISSFPYPIFHAEDILLYHAKTKKSISQLVLENELFLHSKRRLDTYIREITRTMLLSIFVGCNTQGILPGGLLVHRRAFGVYKNLMKTQGRAKFRQGKECLRYLDKPSEELHAYIHTWFQHIHKDRDFVNIIDWVICFALAVNETNAASGRIVTAPTNGSAGVIPAVLAYYMYLINHEVSFAKVKKFLLTASVIGVLFKQNATISAAAGGCQAEIGVSSAMAAAGLTAVHGGNTKRILMAAEIAMEHHLGLTCDPVRGLVQIPCIERNSMGAVKAITASQIALNSNPDKSKVSLDEVIHTMWETAQDMNYKYKETADGGLANTLEDGPKKGYSRLISVNIPEC